MFVSTENAIWFMDFQTKPRQLYNEGCGLCSISSTGELFVVTKKLNIKKFSNL